MTDQAGASGQRIEWTQFELIRKAPIWRRLQLTGSFFKTARQLGWLDLRNRHPDDSEEELAHRFYASLFGEGPAPARLERRLDPEKAKAPDIIEITLETIDRLRRIDVPYQITGPLAVSAFGVARSTSGVDIEVDLKPARVGALIRLLKPAFHIVGPDIEEAARNGESFRVIHIKSMVPFDVSFLKNRRFDKSAFRRRLSKTVTKRPVRKAYFASPEVSVLNLLESYRLGGKVSEREWKDAVGVIKIQGKELDKRYLKHWAKDLKLFQLLQKAYRDAGGRL